MTKTARKPKEFPKFNVGDTVQNIEWGPTAEHRYVEAVGEMPHVTGYIQVSGLIGWHSARGFRSVDADPPVEIGDVSPLDTDDGRSACGECHLHPGERCDICGRTSHV